MEIKEIWAKIILKYSLKIFTNDTSDDKGEKDNLSRLSKSGRNKLISKDISNQYLLS